MKSILPIILIVLALTGAIAYSLSKRALPQKPTDNIGIPANELEGNGDITPTPKTTNKVTFGTIVVTPTPSKTPTSMPTITETTKGGQALNTAKITKVTKTTVCTPVYGSADTCTEHIVVDTGADSALFFNFAGLAYLGGLISFVKAKSLKR
jgi:hypothetical protein